MACIILDGGVLAIWLGRCYPTRVGCDLRTGLSYICILRSMGRWETHQLEAVRRICKSPIRVGFIAFSLTLYYAIMDVFTFGDTAA